MIRFLRLPGLTLAFLSMALASDGDVPRGFAVNGRFEPSLEPLRRGPLTDAAPRSDHECSGEVGGPMDVRIDIPAQLAPGDTLTLNGSIELFADAPRLALRFETHGPIEIEATKSVSGPHFLGENVPFQVKLRCVPDQRK